MTNLTRLEKATLAAIESAADEAALEAVRVGALGKKGAISALLAELRQDGRPRSARRKAP